MFVGVWVRSILLLLPNNNWVSEHFGCGIRVQHLVARFNKWYQSIEDCGITTQQVVSNHWRLWHYDTTSGIKLLKVVALRHNKWYHSIEDCGITTQQVVSQYWRLWHYDSTSGIRVPGCDIWDIVKDLTSSTTRRAHIHHQLLKISLIASLLICSWKTYFQELWLSQSIWFGWLWWLNLILNLHNLV